MKDNIRNKIAMTTVCVLLGTIVTIQFKTLDDIDNNVISTQRSREIAIEYKKLKSEREKMIKEIKSLEKKVSQYEQLEVNKDPLLENLHKDIEKYKMLSGYKDVKGEGVIIQIDNPPTDIQIGSYKNVLMDNYSFLLEIISLLNAVETEAISINDQRYTSFTEIVPAGELLEINGISFGTPVIIKTIGDPEDIENALRIKGGIIWLMEEGYDLKIKISREKDIIVPKYEKVKEFKHGTSVQMNDNE